MLLFLPLVTLTFGLYLVTLGLWELREGNDRRKYINFMFTGLFLIFLLTPFFFIVAGALDF